MYKLRLIFGIFIVFFALSAPIFGETLHYWRFENSPGFLVDSIGSSNLTGNAAQETIQKTGPGSAFPNYFSVLGNIQNNSTAKFNQINYLSTSLTPITSDFTIEAFFHLESAEDFFGKCIVCSTTDPRFTENWAYALMIRFDQYAGTQPRELVFLTSDGSIITTMPSGLVMDVGIDYYVAVAFGLDGTVSFWVKDLTHDGALQRISNNHTATALNPIGVVAIGDDGTGYSSFELDGLIDEVRISDKKLSEDELLINHTTRKEYKTLADAIAALKTAAGIEDPSVTAEGDINSDERIGIEEAIHALQYTAELRSLIE